MFSATHLLREYPNGEASAGSRKMCSAIGYLRTGVLVTEAVEERKRKRIGLMMRGEEVDKRKRCERPAI